MENEIIVEKQEKVKMNVGKNGMKFIQGFGFFLDKFRDEINNKELVRNSMLENYPNKEESITKWLEWYKNYFNMGRIKGFENSAKISWNV